MKRLIILLSLLPCCAIAQKGVPKFVNDTLYTSSGYKIYEGMTLHFGKGTRPDGKFRYINIKSDATSKMLENDSIVIKKLKNFGISSLDNAYIEIIGKKTFKDGSKGYVDLHVAFDNAIQSNLYHTPGELIVPQEFISKDSLIGTELEKLSKLYQDGTITKEEFELAKKKLLQSNE